MNKKVPILAGIILLCISIWLQITTKESIKHIITRLDHIAYDLQLRAKIFTHKTTIKSPIAIVDIDDRSLNELGRWPWPRNRTAHLIDKLIQKGVVVIAIDMMFPEKEDIITDTIIDKLKKSQNQYVKTISDLKKISSHFDNDLLLAKNLNSGEIVLGLTFLQQPQQIGTLPPPLISLSSSQSLPEGLRKAKGYISNIMILQNSAKAGGFINAFADSDGVIRRVPLVMRYGDSVYPSLALAAVKLYLLTNASLVAATYHQTKQIEGVLLDNRVIPTDAEGEVYIPFKGPSYTFPFYSAIDVINDKIPNHALAGKIVFLGTSAIGLGDLKATAIQNIFPGVEIQATIADGILENNFSFKPAWSVGAEICLTVLIGLTLTFIYPFLGPKLLMLSSFLIPIILILLNNFLWEKTGLIIYIFIPILLCMALGIMNMLYGFLFESRRREHLKMMFGQYVPEKHIDEMLYASSTYALNGEDREMTVLFADIRNFTRVAEALPAKQLKELLNQLLTPLTAVIFKHDGTIDKYIGDLIMAFWGAPLDDPNHIEHALSAALEMQEEANKLNEQLKGKWIDNLAIGIGLNTGVMSVGDMGSTYRRNYTVLGDAVNLASRVESLTKYYEVKIMVTENLIQKQDKFLFRLLDKVKVKGKINQTLVYELVGVTSLLSPAKLEEIHLSNEAMQYYFAQNWNKAESIITELARDYPEVKFYQIMLQRLIVFRTNPPPSTWDGSFEHVNK